jgi:V/A-type H+-transporting ATPase subunit E
MEELRTTEVLSKEILEDARKKAYKILNTSEDSLRTQSRDWEKKLKHSLDALRKTYAERTKIINEEIQARFPLDKRRLRSEITENYLVKTMDAFLRSLPREKLLFVLKKELSLRLKACAGELAHHRFVIHYSGLSLDEAKAVFEKMLKEEHCEFDELKFGEFQFVEDSVTREFPLILIDSKVLRIIASVKSAAKTLLRSKRAELAAALLGDGVLDD